MMIRKTRYFEFRSVMADRSWIKVEWIERVIANPLRKEVQEDGRIRLWGIVPEAEQRVLRVIVLEDGVTVHNAFFDRKFKENKDEG